MQQGRRSKWSQLINEKGCRFRSTWCRLICPKVNCDGEWVVDGLNVVKVVCNPSIIIRLPLFTPILHTIVFWYTLNVYFKWSKNTSASPTLSHNKSILILYILHSLCEYVSHICLITLNLSQKVFSAYLFIMLCVFRRPLVCT